MDNATFNSIVEAKIEEIRNTLVGKAKEYAADHDRLHNFAVTAKVRDQNLTQALAGMMVKHTVSVYDMINSGEAYSKALWDEKTGDHLVYLLLLQATIVEDGLIKLEPGEINALYNNAQTSGKVLDVASLYPAATNDQALTEWERELLHGPHHEGVSSLNEVAQKNIDLKNLLSSDYVNLKESLGDISDEKKHETYEEHVEDARNNGRLPLTRVKYMAANARALKSDGNSNAVIASILGIHESTVLTLLKDENVWTREDLEKTQYKNLLSKKVESETQDQINAGIKHLDREREEAKSLSLNHQRAQARRQRVIKAQLMNLDGYSNESIVDELGVKDATISKYLSEPPYLRELPSWQSELYRLPQEAYAEGGFDYDYPLSVQCSATENEARLVYVTRAERDLLDLREKLVGNVTDTDHWKFIYNLRKNPNLARAFNRHRPETIQTEVQEDPSGTPPVIFQTQDRAKLCLTVLKASIEKNQKVSYADYIRICRNIGLSGVHAFDGAEAQGWTNLFGTNIIKLDHGGYTLALPGMVELR